MARRLLLPEAVTTAAREHGDHPVSAVIVQGELDQVLQHHDPSLELLQVTQGHATGARAKHKASQASKTSKLFIKPQPGGLQTEPWFEPVS